MIEQIQFPSVEFVDGGVTAPQGFTASGVIASIKPSNKTKRDLALLYSQVPCQAAAMYTTNKVQGAPLQVLKNHLHDGMLQAVIINSGNANTCNADGEEKAEMMCSLCADALGLDADLVGVSSTGVIGQPLPIQPIADHVDALAKALSKQGATDAAEAIMTTDTVKKELAVTVEIGEKTVTIAGMAKGSGMIHPNMATMLCFLTTDAKISSELLQQALKTVVNDTFNMVSVDGDTSTNDTCMIMASGMAENAIIDDANAVEYQQFVQGLSAVLINLSRAIAADGEGATKLLECSVNGAIDVQNAKIVAKAVITSTLFKCAMFGKDANWGRILCAIGYAPATFTLSGVEVLLCSENGSIQVCNQGAGVEFSEEKALEILQPEEVKIIVNLADGDATAVAWGCDLTYDYVKINGDYRT